MLCHLRKEKQHLQPCHLRGREEWKPGKSRSKPQSTSRKGWGGSLEIEFGWLHRYLAMLEHFWVPQVSCWVLLCAKSLQTHHGPTNGIILILGLQGGLCKHGLNEWNHLPTQCPGMGKLRLELLMSNDPGLQPQVSWFSTLISLCHTTFPAPNRSTGWRTLKIHED